ncbi:HNH endonuclease [Paucibacter sp. PLA-PC-4]|uniref:HNH endonuclease n=1 Tax=Paucibacter sp. PLA-PC-4 TaxID=2993655 RepID=UPI003A4C779C
MAIHFLFSLCTGAPWESEHLALNVLLASLDLFESERDALVKARIGQGRFRAQLEERWKGCSATDCSLSEVLFASHIVPRSECTGAQGRWSVDNGLLLSPALDKLFDRGGGLIALHVWCAIDERGVLDSSAGAPGFSPDTHHQPT